jgi:hypothetical protein
MQLLWLLLLLADNPVLAVPVLLLQWLILLLLILPWLQPLWLLS